MHRSAGLEDVIRARRLRLVAGRLEARTGPEEFTAGLALADGDDTVWLYLGAGAGQQIEIDLRDLPRLRALVARLVPEPIGAPRARPADLRP